MSISVKDLADCLGARVVGDGELTLTDVASLPLAGTTEISYVEGRKQWAVYKAGVAGAVLISAELADGVAKLARTALVVDNPQKSFIDAMLLFRPPREKPRGGISPQAFVSPSARFGADCTVLPGAHVGEDVFIGNRCQIGPGVVIGPGCVLGDDCTLHAHAVLYPDITLGNRVLVHAHAVIGCDGFGYRFEKGQLLKIPHTGTVHIHDDVEIGAGTTIDRGMIEATVIGAGTKLDNQVQIAHNCRIGKGNAFAAQVGLAGSVTTGDYVRMAGQVGIADHCNIGSMITFGGRAGAFGNVTEPGVYHGAPALPEKEAIKIHLNYLKLPEMREQLKLLAAQVADLEARWNQTMPSSAPQRFAA